MALATLSQDTLRAALAYDPDTGLFTRRQTSGRHGRWAVGSVVGSLTGCGYLCTRVDGRLYQCHRLAWLYVYGELPKHDIDHINGDRLDNRIANLRDVTNAVNRQNTRAPRADSQTRVQGVTLDKRRGVYMARLRVDGKCHWLGAYDSAASAHNAYITAKRHLHVGCTV